MTGFGAGHGAQSDRQSGRDLASLPHDRPWYGDDLQVGDWMALGSTSVSREDILDFAARFDPLPIHLDPAGGPFDDVIASGVHTMALYSSLASRAFIPRLALVAGKGIERLRLPHPVFPGAVLHGTIDIVDIVARSTRADVRAQSTFVDHTGSTVLSFLGITVVRRRPGA